jgi:hypothetical protein
MAGFVYLCPKTGVRVQAFTAEDVTSDTNTYVPMNCIMCQQVHYINSFSGKVLGSTQTPKSR